jgi:putative glutamine amidotransferase
MSVIGVPLRPLTSGQPAPKLALNRAYFDALESAGGLALPIPITHDADRLRSYYELLDGLLLPGGADVEPIRYGAVARDDCNLDVMPELDEVELTLARWAIADGLPVLAICRGIQELNAALGGTLHQRVHELPGRLDHRTKKDAPEGPYGPAHEVALTSGGLLAALAGCDRVTVNSLHSQGVDTPAARLRVEAIAPDGQIEAVSLPGARFVVGVQWHPEYKARDNPLSCALFSAFSEACRARRAGTIAKEIAA